MVMKIMIDVFVKVRRPHDTNLSSISKRAMPIRYKNVDWLYECILLPEDSKCIQ